MCLGGACTILGLLGGQQGRGSCNNTLLTGLPRGLEALTLRSPRFLTEPPTVLMEASGEQGLGQRTQGPSTALPRRAALPAACEVGSGGRALGAHSGCARWEARDACEGHPRGELPSHPL